MKQLTIEQKRIEEYEEMVQELVQLCKASDIVRRQREKMEVLN